jgi:CRP-like cAMP-binding protein
MFPFLAKLETRSSFTAYERTAILGLPCRPQQVNANRDFVRQGEHVDHSTFVLEGVVGAFKQDSEGNRQIVSIYLNGDMIDLHTAVLPESSSALQALCPTMVLRVPHSAIRGVGLEHPMVQEAFWRECVVDAGILMEWVINVGRRNARTRLAHFLCELAFRITRATPEDGAMLPYPITQQQLADILSLTSVHVNRTLKSLRRDGAVEMVERSILRILDWNMLATLGEFDPYYLHIGMGTDQTSFPAEGLQPS